MIKRIFIYIVALVILVGCSDELDNFNPGRLEEDGQLHLSFGIAPMTSIQTRTGDNPVTVEMYVFDASTGEKLQVETLTLDGSYTANVMLNTKVMNEYANPKFYFVANKPAINTGSDSSTVGLLGATTLAIENGGNFVMSSKASGISLSEIESTVMLYHNAAKISAHNAVATNDKDTYPLGYMPGNKSYDFIAQGMATESLIMAGGLNLESTTAGLGVHDSENISGEDSFSSELFVHPTDNSSNGNKKTAWIIVKAQYPANKEDAPYYYYRLDFQDRQEGSDDGVAVDIRPNYKYQFLIREVLGPGYNTIQEAANNPTPLSVLNYIIYDHAPVIFNTVSDGKRLLGVSKSVTCNNPDGGDATFYVKLYSPEDDEMDEITQQANIANIFNIPVSWLSVSTTSLPVQVSGDAVEGNSTGVGTGDDIVSNEGNVYKVTVTFGDTNDPGTLKSKLTVNWHGLSRPVDVIWNREFDASKIFDPDVKIKIFKKSLDTSSYDLETLWYSDDQIYTDAAKGVKNDLIEGKKEGMNYFNSSTGFLKTRVEGVSMDDNNGTYRNDGLHFSMPYGEGDDKWTYMYKLTLSEGIFSDLTGEDKGSWDVSASGLTNLKIQKPTIRNKDNRIFYVYRTSSKKDFNYEEGSLKITVKINGKDISYNNVKLYHTGFFHWDDTNSGNNNSSENSGASNNKGYTSSVSGTTQHPNKFNYYEVVKVGEGEEAEYWLDRNMGARSAQSHIDGGTQNERAVGYYMVAAQYHEYHDPIIYKNSVPPGYQVPNVAQWNKLKNAPNFSIVQVGAYYNPTLMVGSKEVYFPKARYYDGNTKSGEDRAGYYWTRDPGTGTEKKEVGNWLRCIQFAGTATSVINGRVNGKDNGQGYYMSMRAVADLGREATYPEKFYFLVKGVTHVFLYREDVVNGKTVRTAPFTWPGKSIGNHLTASKTFSFSYETTTSKPNELRVIFNYVDDNGIIHTYSKNEFSGSLTHDNIRPEDAIGWSVIDTDRTETGAFPAGCGVTISNVNNSLAESENVSCNGTLWSVASPYVVYPDYTLALDGSAFNGWNNYSTTLIYDPNSKTWKCKAKVNAGQFQITKIPRGNKTYYKANASGVTNVKTDGTENKAKVDGSNWNFTESGNYDIEFDENNLWLKVTKIPEKKYRIYWPNTYSRIHIWTGSNHNITAWDNGANMGPEGTASDRSGYLKLEFEGSKVTNPNEEFKYCFIQNNPKSSGVIFDTLFELQDDGYYCAYITENNSNKAFSGKPTPIVSTTTFKINGQDKSNSNWHDITLTADGDNWTASVEFAAGNEFIIKDSDNKNWQPSSAYTVTSSGISNYQCFADQGSGKNFKIQTAGKYTITFNGSTHKLTVTPIGGGQSGKRKFRIYWQDAENRKGLHVWNDKGDFTTWSNDGNYHQTDNTLSGYLYVEFETENYGTGSGNVKFKFMQENGNKQPDLGKTLEQLCTDVQTINGETVYCAYVLYDNEKVISSLPSRPSVISSGKRRIYCQNNANWSTISVYYWGDSQNSWPGESMTRVGSTSYWYKDVPSNVNNIQFNVGSNSNEFEHKNIVKYKEVFTNN